MDTTRNQAQGKACTGGRHTAGRMKSHHCARCPSWCGWVSLPPPSVPG